MKELKEYPLNCLQLLFTTGALFHLTSCNFLVPETASKTEALFRPGVSDAGTNRTSFLAVVPFDFGTDAQYTFDSSKILFSGGTCKLISLDQIDDSAAEISAGVSLGVARGTLNDGTTVGLELGNAGGCDGTATNCSELDSSWTPQWSSLRSYYKMNNAWTDSKGTNNGTPSAGVSFSTARKLGSHSGSFPGNPAVDNVDLGAFTSLDGVGEFSISAWLRTNEATFSAFPGIFSRGTATYVPAIFGLQGASNLIMRFSTTLGGANDCNVSSSSGLKDGEWTHIVATWDGSNCRFYFNGLIDSSFDATGGTVLSNTDGNNVIGTFPGGSSFNGLIDEVAIWTKKLTDDEIFHIYSRQSAKFAGTFTSRLMDTGASASWTTLEWLPTLPFFKELPDYSGGSIQNETTANYSALVGSTGVGGANDLMIGVVGLWHLNEPAGTNGAGTVIDDSGNGNNGTTVNGISFGQNSLFHTAANFDGTDDQILIPNNASLNFTSAALTLSAWVYLKQTQGGYVSILRKESQWALDILNTNTMRALVMASVISGWTGANDEAFTFVPRQWYHVAFTYNGNALRLFVNGTQLGADKVVQGTIVTNANDLYMSSTAGGSYLNAIVDEVAIWNRALHNSEIRQLYQRGASRIKYQVRTCAVSPCNENTETWIGPDGTSGSYFSELHNNTVPLDGSGDVETNLPSLLFSSFTTAPSNNRYFQY